MIQVKENAPDLLRRAPSRTPVDVVATGDCQMGRKGLESIENVGLSLAQVIEGLLKGWMSG